MVDVQFSFLKNEIQAMRLDMKGLQEQIENIHLSLKSCQSHCYIPGPPPTFRSIGRQLIDRFVEKIL